jgi:hypothetical protein
MAVSELLGCNEPPTSVRAITRQCVLSLEVLCSLATESSSAAQNDGWKSVTLDRWTKKRAACTTSAAAWAERQGAYTRC